MILKILHYNILINEMNKQLTPSLFSEGLIAFLVILVILHTLQ